MHNNTLDIITSNPMLIRLDIRINGHRRIKEVARERKTLVKRNKAI